MTGEICLLTFCPLAFRDTPGLRPVTRGRKPPLKREQINRWLLWVFRCLCFAALFALIIEVQGGTEKIFPFSDHPAHKYTALSMLEGRLHFKPDIRYGYNYDLQVFNGAVYTNWGFGVPLLQLPFHWLKQKYFQLFAAEKPDLFVAASFFPDRLIFLFYLVAVLLLLAYALKQK